MRHSCKHRQSALGPFPGRPAPRLYERVVEVVRLRQCRFVITMTGKGLMRRNLNVNYVDEKVSSLCRTGYCLSSRCIGLLFVVGGTRFLQGF
jgi:hypothetical protein